MSFIRSNTLSTYSILVVALYFFLYDSFTQLFVYMKLFSSPLINSFLALGLFGLVLIGLTSILSKQSLVKIFGQRFSFKLMRVSLFYAIAFIPVYFISMISVISILDYFELSAKAQQQPLTLFQQLNLFSFEQVAAVIMITCIVPIIEEVIFRGYLLYAITTICSIYKSFFITGVIFAACHLSYSYSWFNIVLLILLTEIGVFFAYIRYKTSSLWSSILLHSLFNGINLMLA